MGDPLYADGVGLAVVLITLLKVLVAFAFTLVATMFMVWFERKIIADMQHRIGPNRAGPWGILQTLADGTKLFFKEDLLPDRADRRVFRLAPVLAVVPAFLSFAIIPLGGNFATGDGTVSIFGHRTFLQLADPPVGVLFFLAMSGLGVYGVMLAGYLTHLRVERRLAAHTVSSYARDLRALDDFQAPVVLKADGLAAGKGVVIAQTMDEARQTVKQFMAGELVGAAGQRLVIEELDRKSTRLNSSHVALSRMPSSA